VKMAEAMRIMEARPAGFMVAFEHVDGSILASDHFPDVRNGEKAIPTEDEAWQMAAQFAAQTRKRCVNVYVIRREDFTPVARYRERMIENR
jgi:hypothetical protein